jgi:hypothetical protein
MNKNNQFSSETFSVNLLVFKSYFQVKRFPFFRDNFDILVTTEILLENRFPFNPGSDQTGFALSFFFGGGVGMGGGRWVDLNLMNTFTHLNIQKTLHHDWNTISKS